MRASTTSHAKAVLEEQIGHLQALQKRLMAVESLDQAVTILGTAEMINKLVTTMVSLDLQ